MSPASRWDVSMLLDESLLLDVPMPMDVFIGCLGSGTSQRESITSNDALTTTFVPHLPLRVFRHNPCGTPQTQPQAKTRDCRKHPRF